MLARTRTGQIEVPVRCWPPSARKQETPDSCLQAALAFLLELEIEQVPRFDETAIPGKNQNRMVRDWLATIGFDLWVWIKPMGFAGMHIQCGHAERGHGHAVVMRGDVLVFDPHPSGAGLISVDEWWLVLPLEPAAALPCEVTL